ncbi:hypothetical protein BGZ58_004293 [Dissophora ornata]|nr:hypothetical protein BGZ58_004293 [Dissophora ornata]
MWALDAEWKPFIGYGKQGRIALIQLGNDDTIYLFHVIHMKKFPEQLAHLLEDKKTLKVGINIRNDGTKIMKDWGVGCANLVELGALSLQVQDNLANQRKIRSMDRLAKELLGHAVEKVAMTRMGNWESKYLTASQLAYAANDVFVTYEVAERIKYLQNAQPSKDYVIPLATIQADGALVVTVRGTLQEREDFPATTNDIVVDTKKGLSIEVASPILTSEKVKVVPGYTFGTMNQTRWSSGLKASPTSKKSANTASLSAVRPPPPRTISTSKIIYRKGAKFSALDSEPDIFYGSHADAETKHAIQFGGRSVVTIIRPNQQQRRSFSHTAFVRVISNGHNNDLSEIKSRKRGDIYVPREILPESLEGKDILERNQAVWQEAGGREFFEEIDNRGTEDDDWHLRQNQALFESLMTNSKDQK